MALADYSHVISTGFNCMPVRQLQLASQRLDISAEQLKGPFDWMVAPLSAVLVACENDFNGYFDQRKAKIVGTLGEYWRVWSPEGFLSIHHFHREECATEISADAWCRFREWFKQRLAAYQAALADPYGHTLILRVEDYSTADDPHELARLYSAISGRARSNVTLVNVSFREPRYTSHPRMRALCIEPSWPDYLPLPSVDWNFDYGSGVAWEGHEASWQRLWMEV